MLRTLVCAMDGRAGQSDPRCRDAGDHEILVPGMLYPASQEARRALELIAAHPDGCTEAVLAAED